MNNLLGTIFKIILIFSVSGITYAESEYWLRGGFGKGFSEFEKERHEDSHMYYMGLRAAYIHKKWEYSVSADVMMYEINTRLKQDEEYKKARHTNENVLVNLHMKYRAGNWRLGQFLGRHLYENHLTVEGRSQDIFGLDAGYMINEDWIAHVSVETNIDDEDDHRMLKFGIEYKLGPKPKERPVITSSAPRCSDREMLIFFENDSVEINEFDLARLKRFSEGLSKIVIEGYASKLGTDEYNEKLAAKRAITVYDLILVDSAKWISHGERKATEDERYSRKVIIKGCK